MRNNGHLLVLFFILVVGFLITLGITECMSQPSGKDTFQIFYSGSRRSELIPCGCKGKKQIGGIDREATDLVDAIVDFMRNQSRTALEIQQILVKAKVVRDRNFLQSISVLIILAVLFGLFFTFTIINDFNSF